MTGQSNFPGISAGRTFPSRCASHLMKLRTQGLGEVEGNPGLVLFQK